MNILVENNCSKNPKGNNEAPNYWTFYWLKNFKKHPALSLRVNRAICLKLSDFDFKRNVPFIKGDKGKKDRYVMLSKNFIEDLTQYLKIYPLRNTLFPGTDGEDHISDRTANRILHRAAYKAGVRKKISFHTLRHSFATHLHEADYSLRDIQYLMGHSSSKTTEKYIKISTRHISNIISPLDRLEDNLSTSNKNKNLVTKTNFNTSNNYYLKNR